MRDLIFVSLEDWDEIWRRNQFLCAALTRRFPEMKILFIGRSRDLTNNLRRGQFDAKFRRPTWQVPEFPRVTVTHPLKIAPNTLAIGRRINDALARRHVRRVARDCGIRGPLLWLNPHSAGHMVGHLGECGSVYDITDDWQLMASLSSRERALIAQQDQALCGTADLVIVCSEALAETRRPMSRRLVLIPNGVDAAHYAKVSTTYLNGSRRWPSPVFGYTGTLHHDRLDSSLIVALARAFPGGRVALVGPNHLRADVRRILDAEPNIVRPGQVPYGEIPATMAEFDVCIVPHLESPFVESLNPIKLWEYLACGKPIVSTNVAGFRDYQHLCRIATGAEPFVAACRKALEEKDRCRDARLDEARKHTWDVRVDALVEVLQQHRMFEHA